MTDIAKSRLVPFDPSRPSVEAMTADGPVLVNREPMRSVLVVTIEELARMMGLPADHRIERITVSDASMAPAVLVMVEGPAMAHQSTGVPIRVEAYARVMDDMDERRRSSADYWLRNAVKPRAFE